MKLFDLSLQFNGYQIKEAKQTLTKIQSVDDSTFEAYVNEQKWQILNFHLQNNSFYKALANKNSFSNWNAVPILTKRDLQVRLENRLSKGYSTKSVYVNKTSGSSGDPFVFAKDRWCHAMTWAVIMDRFSWYNIDFNTSKQARFYGIPLDNYGYFKERFKDWLSHRYRFSIFDLSDNAFEKCLQKFNKTAFQYINGYTSAIVQFAKYLKRQNIVLNNVCPSLTYCFVTSEMLFDDDKALMASVFGVPVINEYGASELDLIAFQNPQGEFQINNETLYVEILDEQDNVLPHGHAGRIVITSFFNKAHPFIRYDIGDIGIISEHSTPKKLILDKLIGRTNDIALLPSGKSAAGLTFYYVTKSIVEDDGNVKEFIIEQQSLSQFKVSYVSLEPLSTVKEDIIKKEMINYLEPGIDITFERMSKLNRSKSGKLKQFTSYVNTSS